MIPWSVNNLSIVGQTYLEGRGGDASGFIPKLKEITPAAAEG